MGSLYLSLMLIVTLICIHSSLSDGFRSHLGPILSPHNAHPTLTYVCK